MSQKESREKSKTRTDEDDSKLSYEDRVLKRMLNTPPRKKRKQEKQKKEPG